MLHLTTIGNVEKCIERHRKRHLGQIPQDINNLQRCLQQEDWKQLLQLDVADAFVVEFIIQNSNTKAIIFIDKTLADKIIRINKEKVTIFVDGTFATVPQLQNTNCQLWTIVMRYNNRVSKTNY